MSDPSDERDLAIHYDIERMIEVFTMRGLSRAEVLKDLRKGDEKFSHGVNAICELRSIPMAELRSRIVAFCEADEDEEKARAAIDAVLQRESEQSMT